MSDPKPPDPQDFIREHGKWERPFPPSAETIELIRKHGAYGRVSPEAWAKWDKMVAEYQTARRAYLNPLEHPEAISDPEALCICGCAGVYWRPRKGGGRAIWRCEEHRDRWPDYACETPQKASR